MIIIMHRYPMMHGQIKVLQDMYDNQCSPKDIFKGCGDSCGDVQTLSFALPHGALYK